MMLELKQHESVKEREWGNILKVSDTWELVEKERGKEKRTCGKGSKTKIVPCNATRKRQAPSLTIGIQ